MGYKSPILTEIYVELILSGDGLGSGFVELIPNLKKVSLTAVELSPVRHFSIHAVGNEDPKVTREQVPRVRVWNNEKTKLVQLSKNQIAVNLVGQYPGWESFKTLFNSALNEIKEKSQFSIESVTLSTIDKASVPSKDFKVDKYLNTNGDIVPKYFESCAEAADLIIGKGALKTDGKNRQFQISWAPKGSHYEIVIQSRFQNLLIAADKNIAPVLEALHEESVNTFEGMITDIMRNEIMGGLV